MSDVATISGIPGYVDVYEAARIIGVSYSQACRYIDLDLLTVYEVGSQRLIKRKDAEKFQRPPRGNPAFRRESARQISA